MPYNLAEFKQWLKAKGQESILVSTNDWYFLHLYISDGQLFQTKKFKDGSCETGMNPAKGELASAFETWKQEIDLNDKKKKKTVKLS